MNENENPLFSIPCSFIYAGQVIISKREKVGSTESKVVHIARPTECFGELALLYNHPRAATAKVLIFRHSTECC